MLPQNDSLLKIVFFFLLKFADISCSKEESVSFSFYGAPSLDSPINRIIDDFLRMRFPERIAFYGHISGSDNNDVFHRADIFCLPTFYQIEALPISIIEAMQFCLPVISTIRGAIPEAIIDRKGGLLIAKESIDELVIALTLLMSPSGMVEIPRLAGEGKDSVM